MSGMCVIVALSDYCRNTAIMTKYCPICRVRYEEAYEVCPVDGMRLFRKPDSWRGRLVAGRYELGDRIGSGGMAVVYRSLDRRTGETRAVKMLRPELSRDESQRIRFLREVRAARAAEHENIVHIHDLGETEDGTAFIVLEYLDGRTVGQAARDGLMPLRRVLDIVGQTCRGLEKAHLAGVLHRDIKPDNLMLVPEGAGERVKILDFGLATMKGDLRLTDTGQVFGTPEYLSPEQATGQAACAASDQYSTGVVFYEMLTGSPPFVGDPAQVMMAHFKRAPVPPSMVRIDRPVPEQFDELVLGMLAKHPAQRHPDLARVGEHLWRLRSLV